MKKLLFLKIITCGGDQVVSVLVFQSNDPSSNHDEDSLYSANYLKRTKTYKKRLEMADLKIIINNYELNNLNS